MAVQLEWLSLRFSSSLDEADVEEWLTNPSYDGLQILQPEGFEAVQKDHLMVVEEVSRSRRTASLSLWFPLPLGRRCHSTMLAKRLSFDSCRSCRSSKSKSIREPAFLDSDPLINSRSKPKDKPPAFAELEGKLSYVLCPFQREGVVWMAGQEAKVSSLTHGIFNHFEMVTQDGLPLFGSQPNPSETLVWRDWPKSRSGGFLADEPGLGKTVQMVTLMNLCGFHYRDTPPWVKGPYGQWLKPLSKGRYRLRRYEGSKGRSTTAVLHGLDPWSPVPYPWFCPDVPLGGTLIVFPTTLSGQWEDELRDKSLNEHLSILNLSKTASMSLDGLLAQDVVLVTHGMLRAERRRSGERILWDEPWTCRALIRESLSSSSSLPLNAWKSLEHFSLLSLLPWGTEVLIDRVEEDGTFYGWPWSPERDRQEWDESLGPSTTTKDLRLDQMDWKVVGQLTVCSCMNRVKEGATKSQVVCSACGAHPSPPTMKALTNLDPSPLFRIWWRRVILDESDRLTSMPQTLNDVTRLQTHVLWCLTGTPNGTDPRFGHNFLQQLELFFVNGGRPLENGLSKDVGLALQEWRDPAFQGDLVDLWMMRRTKEEVKDQLSLPPVDFHTLEVVLEERDGKGWIEAMHRDMAAIGSTRFGRLWRVLTIQEGLDSVILVDNMEVDLEGPGKDCPVCMDKIEEGKCVKTPCSHFFCKTCIQTWMARAPTREITCPACRFILTPKNLMLALEPALEPSFTPGNLAKLRTIQGLLGKIPSEERILIATRYPEAMATLTRVLGCPSLHVKMTKTKRDKILREGWTRCLVISMNLHGFGLNLTQANHLILVDQPSKAHHSTQLVGRVYRIGQKRHVHIYRLVTKGTLEEWVDTGTDLTKVLASIFATTA